MNLGSNIVPWLAAAAILVLSPAAWANPYDVYGPGGQSSAMGGAQTADAEGVDSLYDNVAGLAGAAPGLQVGTFATFGDAPILLKERPDGYDVPDLGAHSPALPSAHTRNERRDTDSPRPLFGVEAGVITDFGDTETRGAAAVMIPTNGVFDAHTRYADERERIFSNQLHHEIIGSRLHRPVIELGVARALTDWLAVGIGGTYLPGTSVSTETYVSDPADQSDVELNAEIDTTNQWGLLAGVVADLPADISAGLAFRQGVAFEMDGGNEVQVRGMNGSGDTSRQQMNWVPVSTPTSVRAGVAREFGDVQLALDTRYTFWSAHRDTQGEHAGFNDTLQGRLGAEWTYSQDTRLRGGLGFVPTPVPDQTGRTNYVDNSRVLASVGAGHRFRVGDRQMEASWHLQFQHLLLRDTDKQHLDDYPNCTPEETALCDEVPDDLEDPDTGQAYPEAQGLQTGNPGFPGFVSGGWIGSVGLQLRY